MDVGPFVIIPGFIKFHAFSLSIFSFCCSSWVNSIDLFSSSLTISYYVYCTLHQAVFHRLDLSVLTFPFGYSLQLLFPMVHLFQGNL